MAEENRLNNILMADEDTVIQETSSPEEVSIEASQETSMESTTIDTRDEDLAKARELAENYKIRAEKAERELKKPRETPTAQVHSQEDTPQLNIKDQLFLAKADIHPDDIEEVLDWAKFKKIGIQDAYKALKPKLDANSEERKTAAVANVSSQRRSAAKVTDDMLIQNAKSGKLPDADDDIARLVKAQMLANRG